MLQLDSITLRFGDDTLFDNVSTLVNIGERIGLVGPNGAGKSTLLKIIAGELEPDEGTVVLSSGETVGYLPQDGVDPDPNLTVYEEVESAFHEILSLQEELQNVRENMENLPPDTAEYQEALKAFGRKQDQLENSRAYTLKTDIERILMGLGFNEKDFDRSTTEFSGGWLMRIALAKLLLRTPEYLLLDEPTNHLDIESLQWIERFLKNYDGTVIVVSHDRAFLDSLTHRTLALRNGDMHDYAGNYSFFEKKFEEEMEQLRKEYQNQQKELKQTQEFIDRFRYKASKAKQVQSRIKQLEKMEMIELENEQDEISFRFPQPERSGQIVMRLEDLNKSYGDHSVFSGIDYIVERGDKIAVVGPNGAGKSTLIRIIAGLEPYDGGKRVPGHNVTPSYFAQHQSDELNTENNALEEIRAAAPRESETRLRTLLGCFLFSGDDVFKKISVLSGGEKSRLALAKMLIRPANFIILDEPTNHLDMQSKKILQEALNQFEGTCMIVSHDRDFLDPVVNKTLEVQPDSIKTWVGNVSYYLDRKAEQEQEEATQKSEDDPSGQNEKLSRKDERRIEAQIRNEKSRKTRPLKKRLDTTEENIRQMEERIADIEKNMAKSDFYEDSDKVREISMEYEQLKQELNESLSKWEELAGRIEFIEQEVEERMGRES